MAHCREKDLRQTLQTNGFSPVWALRCLARCSDLRKVREQNEHFFSAELVLVVIAAHNRSKCPSFVHYYCCGQSRPIFRRKSKILVLGGQWSVRRADSAFLAASGVPGGHQPIPCQHRGEAKGTFVSPEAETRIAGCICE